MTPDSKSRHQHTPEEKRRIREASLDATLEATFPASDPLSSMPDPDDETVFAREDEARREAG